MKERLEIIKDSFLKEASLIKFRIRRDLFLYLNQDYENGDVIIELFHRGSSENCGKLRFNLNGKLRESYLLSSRDLEHLVPKMQTLKKQQKHEQICISRDAFLTMNFA